MGKDKRLVARMRSVGAVDALLADKAYDAFERVVLPHQDILRIPYTLNRFPPDGALMKRRLIHYKTPKNGA